MLRRLARRCSQLEEAHIFNRHRSQIGRDAHRRGVLDVNAAVETLYFDCADDAAHHGHRRAIEDCGRVRVTPTLTLGCPRVAADNHP